MFSQKLLVSFVRYLLPDVFLPTLIYIFTCFLSCFLSIWEISRILHNYNCRLFLISYLASSIKHSSLKSSSQMSSDSLLVSAVQSLAFIGHKESFFSGDWSVMGGGHMSNSKLNI
jgi:hypothetical protein